MKKSINRFNDIQAKEWLPFQKSWQPDLGTEDLYRKNLRFFTQASTAKHGVSYLGADSSLFAKVCQDEQLSVIDQGNIHFALWDLRNRWSNLAVYRAEKPALLQMAKDVLARLEDRRFLCVLIDPDAADQLGQQIGWDFGQSLAQIFSLKDEKLLAEKSAEKVSYALYFRKDESSLRPIARASAALLQHSNSGNDRSPVCWQVVRPKPRSKASRLHPASFPVELVQPFIEHYTKPGQTVLDPMCGSGSALVAAVQSGRKALGVELSPKFVCLAQQRINEVSGIGMNHPIYCMDAGEIQSEKFPPVDYVFTSPPYWNVLRAKGGEGQQKRKDLGLPTVYSELARDLGNIPDYDTFLQTLTNAYTKVWDCLKPDGHMTVVVKNFKRHGRNYHFASDLSECLAKKGWQLLPPQFWLQDDVKLFPFGYHYTWVSNVCHSYVLTFRKPLS